MLLDGDHRLPLYARLRDVLATQVAELVWKVDEAIPTESELSSEYGVSVHTVRKAVEQLVNEGLLERRHGSGTYVRRPSFHNSLFRWFNFEDTTQSGHKTVPESRLVSREVKAAPLETIPATKLLRSTEVIHLERVRLWSGTPLMLEDIYLPYPKFQAVLHDDEAEIGPLLYPYYERRFSRLVTEVEDEISVGLATERLSEFLSIEAGAPVVQIDRLSKSADGVLEVRRAYGRGDRFRYRVKMS